MCYLINRSNILADMQTYFVAEYCSDECMLSVHCNAWLYGHEDLKDTCMKTEGAQHELHRPDFRFKAPVRHLLCILHIHCVSGVAPGTVNTSPAFETFRNKKLSDFSEGVREWDFIYLKWGMICNQYNS